MARIEFVERFLDLTEEEIDKYEATGIPYPKNSYSYRRVYVPIEDIFAVKEMIGKRAHCLIEFRDGSIMMIKGSYDDVSIKVNDAENANLERELEDLEELLKDEEKDEENEGADQNDG